MTANPILLQKKYSRVIECFAKQQGLSLDAALDFFYHSQVYQLIREGVSDMHCMSDAYLAEELKQEYEEKVRKSGKEEEKIRNIIFLIPSHTYPLMKIYSIFYNGYIITKKKKKNLKLIFFLETQKVFVKKIKRRAFFHKPIIYFKK